IGEQTYPLPDPFLVLATQNPIEQEGTYQLPEAQLDRFMFKLNIGYPQKREERSILDLMATSAPDLRVDPVVDPKQIIAGPDVLRHRIIVSYEAEAEAVTSETIIERIFAGLPVP